MRTRRRFILAGGEIRRDDRSRVSVNPVYPRRGEQCLAGETSRPSASQAYPCWRGEITHLLRPCVFLFWSDPAGAGNTVVVAIMYRHRTVFIPAGAKYQ